MQPKGIYAHFTTATHPTQLYSSKLGCFIGREEEAEDAKNEEQEQEQEPEGEMEDKGR